MVENIFFFNSILSVGCNGNIQYPVLSQEAIFVYHVTRSRDFFLLPASVQNSEETEELLEAEGIRSIRQKQKIQIPSTFRRRKSNRICNLPLLEHIFWLKSHPACVCVLPCLFDASGLVN